MVALKELQEAGLGPRRPLDPPETKVVAGPLQVPHVHRQVLQPEARTLPHGGQLGGPVQRGELGEPMVKVREDVHQIKRWSCG